MTRPSRAAPARAHARANYMPICTRRDRERVDVRTRRSVLASAAKRTETTGAGRLALSGSSGCRAAVRARPLTTASVWRTLLMMAGGDERRLAGRESAVIWITVILAGVALVFGAWGAAAQRDCGPMGQVVEWPRFVALALGLLCIVPLVLALAWRLRPAIWASTLVAFLVTPVIVVALVLSAGQCPS